MGIELLKRLAEAFDGVASDPGVCAVVLTGQGRSFCAGLDLKIVPSLGLPRGHRTLAQRLISQR